MIEYIAYLFAAFAIFYSIIIGAKVMAKHFFNKKNSRPLLAILRARIIMGNYFILGGHIIRFIYAANLKTFIFLLIVIFIRELLIKYLEKELDNIYYNYGELVAFENKYPVFTLN